jgi:hypothetical protein
MVHGNVRAEQSPTHLRGMSRIAIGLALACLTICILAGLAHHSNFSKVYSSALSDERMFRCRSYPV